VNSNLYSTIITAAGASDSSYDDLGRSVPKNLTLVGGKQILARAIESCAPRGGSDIKVAIRADEEERFSTSKVTGEFFPGVRFSLVNNNLQGALVSALIASEGLDEHSPLVIAGGDSEISGGISNMIKHFIEEKFAAAVIVFESSDPRWSYIRTSSTGMVVQASEKKVIGDLATTGTFFFDSVARFRASAKWCLVNNAQTSGKYFVSSALNFVVSQGDRVGYRQIQATDYSNYRFASDLPKIIYG